MISTIKIAIPVYNEVEEIDLLFESLLKQVFDINYEVTFVIYDDHSTDGTTVKIKKYSTLKAYSKFEFHYNNKNLGKATTLNKIFLETESDYLVLLDSDVRFTDSKSISSLLKPLVENPNAGLSSALAYTNDSKRMIKKVFEFAAKVSYYIGMEKKLASCWGGAMALKKKAYSSIKLVEDSYRTDAYLYLATLNLGMEYVLVEDRRFIDYKDYEKLSFKTYAKMQKRTSTYPDIFEGISPKLIEDETKYSTLLVIKSVIKSYLSNPFNGSVYIFFKASAKLYNLKQSNASGRWRS